MGAKHGTIAIHTLFPCLGTQLYAYTPDLLALASHISPIPQHLPSNLSHITTPLNHHEWQLCLNYHPDQQYVSYILDGITQGFNYDEVPLRSASSIHPSTTEHPDVIVKALMTKINAHRYITQNSSRTSTQAAWAQYPKSTLKNGG